MSDRQAEIRRLIVQLQDEKRQKLTAQRILRAALEEHRLDVDDLETRLTDLQQDYEFNHKQGTWYRHTVETAHVASIDSISFVIVYMNLHRWSFVFFLIVQDCTGGMKRYVVAVVQAWYEREVNGCFSPFCLPSARRLYGIFDAAENPLKCEIIV